MNEKNIHSLDRQDNKSDEEAKKYYTEEYPSGPWSRALFQMRTGKPFSEEEFKRHFEESQTK